MEDDAEQGLGNVVADIQEHAARLRAQVEEVNDLVRRAALIQDDAESRQFLDWWVTQHHPALRRAAEALSEMSESSAPEVSGGAAETGGDDPL